VAGLRGLNRVFDGGERGVETEWRWMDGFWMIVRGVMQISRYCWVGLLVLYSINVDMAQ